MISQSSDNAWLDEKGGMHVLYFRLMNTASNKKINIKILIIIIMQNQLCGFFYFKRRKAPNLLASSRCIPYCADAENEVVMAA